MLTGENFAFVAFSPANVKTTLPPPARRSHSQDSVLRAANTVEKAKASGRPRGTKKGSTHADVIDRLDFSGVGPSMSLSLLLLLQPLPRLTCDSLKCSTTMAHSMPVPLLATVTARRLPC